MKQKCSFILKASTALVLALLMLFGTVTTSLAAVVDNAATGRDADIAASGMNLNKGYIYFDATALIAANSDWGSHRINIIYNYNSSNATYKPMTRISNTNLYYINGSTTNYDNTSYIAFFSGDWNESGEDTTWSNINQYCLDRTNQYTTAYNFNGENSVYYITATAGTGNKARVVSAPTCLGTSTTASTRYGYLNKNLTIKTALKSGTTYAETSTKCGTYSASGAYKLNGTSSSTASSISSAGVLTTARTTTSTISQTTASGYTFKGWKAGSLDSSGSGLSTGNYSFTNTGSDATVYAYYEVADTTYTGITAVAKGTTDGTSYSVDLGSIQSSTTVSSSTGLAVNAGTQTGYTFSKWVASGSGTFADADSASTTFYPAANSEVATAQYKKNYTFSNGTTDTHGTVTVPSGTVLAGASYSGTVTPADGYKIKSLTVGGVAVSAAVGKTSAYTYSGTTGSSTTGTSTPISVVANFEANTAMNLYIAGRFRVRPSEGSSSWTTTYAGSSDWSATSTNIPFTYLSGTTYKVDTYATLAELSAKIGSSSYTGDPVFFVYDTTNNKNWYASSATTMSTSGTTLVSSGGADSNLKFSSTSTDGPVTVYYDSNTHKIWYSIPDLYNVTVNTATGGSVTASPSRTQENATVTLTITPSSGYQLSSITAKQGTTNVTLSGTGNTRTFTMPAGDVTVTPVFSKIDYTLTKNSTSNGSFKLTNASGTEISTAQIGDTVKVVPTANTGYQVGTVKHGTSSTPTTSITASGGEYSFTMGGANEYVAVTFTPIDYKINNSADYSADHNAGFAAQNVKHYGDSVSITTTSLDAGWQLVSSGVTVKDASNNNVSFTVTPGSDNKYVIAFTMPASNVTIALTATEKATKTITVINTSNGGTGTINVVKGNSVSGAANSFAAGTTTFQAHVDDVLTFSAIPGSQSKLSDAGIKINGAASTTLTVTDAATVTATFVNNPSTTIYVQQIDSTKDKLYVWAVKANGDEDGTVHPLGNWSGKILDGNYPTLKINNKTYYKVEIPETDFQSKTLFGAIYTDGSGNQSGDLKPFAVGGTYKIDATAYSSATMAAWTDTNYAVTLTENGTLNTTHSAAATFRSNSTSSGTTIGTNPANYAGSTITVTAHPKTGYWAFVTATYGGSATTGLAETGSGLVSNIIKKIELAATGAGETAVTVTGSPIKTDGGTATFTMPAGATDITVNYTAIPTYTMKLSAGAHGTIALKSGSTTLKTAAAGTTENVTVTAGTSYSVVVTPDSGYLVKTLSEAGTTVSAAAGQTSAYTHSWTAPDEQPGNTYLTVTFAKNDPEISTLLYNGYDTSGNSVTGYVDKAFKTSTYNGETFAYYKVSGRGTGDHLFTVTNNAEETATGSAIYFTRPNHSYWSSSGVKAHFYTDGSGTIGNEFYEMDFSYNDGDGNAVYRLNLDSYSSLKSALTADTKVTFHNSASVATATGWGLMTWAGCFYCPNAGDNNNFSLAGWPSGQKSDAFNITTGRTYNGGDNGSGKAYQHSNDGYYGSDMPLYNHYTSGYDYEKTNSSSTSDYYILYFYPNTNYGTINNKSANNTNDYPIIVASTKLPNNEDDGKITVYAKYGTVDTGRSPTAEFGSTTVVTNADVEVASTNTTDGYVVAKATPGKSITLTTTVNAANASKYYVKGWDINGTTYGLNPEATGNSYTLTYNIPEDAETLEITPIYWMKDSSKMTRFYVRSFNEAPAAWGDALYCYFYNSSTADIGYPGQPCVHEGALYYTEIPTDSQGITLNNAVWDTIHGEMMMGLSGTTAKQNAHYQTYDYDNFQKIVKEKSDGLKSIYFTFEFRDKKDNLGSTSGSSSSIKLSDYDDTNGNGWEDFKDLKGNFINIFDEELGSGQGQTSLDTNKTLYVISNGYACNYEGEFATEWAVYVSTDGTNATYVTTIPSSALLINSAARLSESVYPNSNTAKYTPLLSSYTSAYNTLKNTYSHYKVKITYEKVLKYGDSVLHGNNIETNDIANRIDGKWDYTKNTDYVVADVKIQYRNTPDGAYTDDTFGGTGNYTGTTTQATAYFTNEEPVVSGATSIYQKTSCPTGTYYVSNDVYFTFLTTPKASAGYQFDGWYMKTDASDEAVLIDTSTSAKSLMDSNATFIARYTKVSSGSLTITHSSSGSGSANRIALKAEVIDPSDNNNVIETYNGTDYVTIPTAYIKNTSSYQVKVTLYSVANPATSYIDMVTNPTAITSEKDGGSVNVFNSPTYTYDRRAASKYNQNVTTVIGAFNISALFSGTTQNTMLINYTTRIDKLPTYTINYRYHGRGQTGDDYMTFTRTISLTPDEAEGKNADGTTYSGNNGQALTATYITSSSDNLVNDITANAPNQNDLQTEVFNKEIEWKAPASIEPNSTTVTAEENDPKYTLTYWYVDGNDGIKKLGSVEAEYNKLITLGEIIGETTTYATAETYGGEKFAYWALGTEYGNPLTSTREYKMRLVNNVTIYPVYGNPANGWNSAIDKITRTHQTSDTSDSIFTDFALRFSGFDENGSFIHINPDYKDKYTVGVAVVYDTEGNNTTATTEQLPDSSGVFYDLSKTTKYKTAQDMIQLLVTGNKTTARLREISDTTYVSKYDADNDLLTNFNRIDYAIKYNYNTYYKRSYDAYAYIVDNDTNNVLAVSPVKSGYLYDGKLPSGNGN